MKKFYNTPEIELVKFTLKDVILTSDVESGYGEEIIDDPITDPDKEL